MEADQITEIINKAVKQALKEVYPKEWLTVKELSAEFDIKPGTIVKLVRDEEDPLPFTTLGLKKQLFRRSDINLYLERRMRNKQDNKKK